MILALLILLAAPQGGTPLADLLTRARDHIEAGDEAAARGDLDEALRLHPTSPAVRNFLGVLAASAGGYEEAERRFREAVERDPRYTDAWLNLGRLLQENAAKDPGAPREALAAYEAILRYEPAHREARFQVAALRQALGEFERSQTELSRLPPEDRDRPAALAVACANHAARGERAEADAAGEALLAHRDLAPADVRPIVPVLASHGRDDLVVRIVETLRQKGLAASVDLEALGAAYARQGQLALSRESLEAATASRPDDPALLLSLARVAYEQGDLKGALGYLGHARAVAPQDPGVHFFLGMVCVELDLGAEAYVALGEAVRLDPDNPEANYAFGSVAMHRKDPTEAVPYFRRYSELRPDDYRGPYAVGVALFLAKDYEAARRQLLPFAEREETAAGADYLLARIARALNEEGEALRLARRAVEADPLSADGYSELGLLYQRAGQVERAEEALKRCLEIDPDHYLGNLHLLLLYSRTRDPRKAAQQERFDELRKRRAEQAADLLRPVEIRPY
ncbi:MAG: tetratricopeptide repeat protein [Acidobacteria bacterium]|nr:tetratricopeptide repeat protein [Acidobacteriota bacterium]